MMDKYTANFGFLVLDYKDQVHPIKHFTAKYPVPPFKIGSKTFWKEPLDNIDITSILASCPEPIVNTSRKRKHGSNKDEGKSDDLLIELKVKPAIIDEVEA